MVDGIDSNNEDAQAEPPGGERTTRVVTVPNILCVIRLVGSTGLVVLALANQGKFVVWLYFFLAMTDWLDGKLAIFLHQRSVLGARLDSWADATLYAGMLFAAFWLHGDTLRSELGWLGAAVGSYAVSTLAGLLKYKRWPSYHTRAAKASWLFIMVGVVFLFGEWSMWPLRVALVVVTITNIEALLMTILSPTWRADVGSVFQVLRERGGGEAAGEEGGTAKNAKSH